MKSSINDQLSQAVASLSNQRSTKPSDMPDQRREFLRETFRQLINMGLMNKPSPEILQTWAVGLSDLSEGQIRMGLVNAKDFREYFNLPAFRDLCKVTTQSLGLPEPRLAYIEACNKPTPWDRQQWSHAAVYAAARETGSFTLYTEIEKVAFPLFNLNYEKMIERVVNGEDLSLPVQKALPEKVPQYLTPDQNKERIEKLKAMLG